MGGIPKELLLHLAGEGADEPDEGARPDHATQITLLRNAMAALHRRPAFKVGDIIRGKREFLPGNIRNWADPHMIAEILTTPREMLIDPRSAGFSSAARRLDAIIFAVSDKSDEPGEAPTVERYFADLAEWELYPQDKLSTDRRLDS